MARASRTRRRAVCAAVYTQPVLQMAIRFTRCPDGDAEHPENAELPEFVRLVNSQWGAQLFEWIAGDPVVRVFFDVDSLGTDATEEELFASIHAALATFFADQPEFDREAEVVFATSRGVDELSIRACAPGYAMRVSAIEARVRALKLGRADGGVFDEAAYRGRCVRAVGSRLGIVDREELPYHIVQHVPGDAIHLQAPNKANTMSGEWRSVLDEVHCQGVFTCSAEVESCLRPVLASPSHDTLSDLFIRGHARSLWCCPEGRIVRHWSDGAWRTLTSAEWSAVRPHTQCGVHG